ncbi:MAG TPA: rhombosortase [Candidatus Didemnitutus sp.]|nr:rhombosortase [Candidatus Didemnitutus sp.]
MAVVAVMLHFAQANAPFLYERRLILNGEIWRMWTGHLAHFGLSHLGWNLCVFVPAGCWFENLRPCAARWLYALGLPFISAILLVADPTLETYAGLSGIATAVLVALAVLQLGRPEARPLWFWWAVLALVAGKVGLELFSGRPLLVSGFDHVRDVPLAHVGGAVAGVATGLLAGWGCGKRHAA